MPEVIDAITQQIIDDERAPEGTGRLPTAHQASVRERIEPFRYSSPKIFEYIMARSQTLTKKEACERIGFTRSWFYQYDQGTRDLMEQLANDLRMAKAEKALYMLEAAAPDAAQVKVDGLSEKNVWVRQQAASEILGRVVGAKPEKKEIEIKGQVQVVWAMPWTKGSE